MSVLGPRTTTARGTTGGRRQPAVAERAATIVSADEAALGKVCGLTLLERNLRALAQTGVREATVISHSPGVLEEAKRPHWSRVSMAVRTVLRRAIPEAPSVTIAELRELADGRPVVYVPAAIVCDVRLFERLLAARETLEDALAGAIDFAAMARTALADWESRSAADRAAYAGAFEKLIRRSLMRRVDVYRIQGVDYASEAIRGDQGTVDTVVRAKEATTEVIWQFVRTPRGWRVSDYSIDGVSTVRNYRRQFARLLETRGWNGLIERINARAAEIEREG